MNVMMVGLLAETSIHCGAGSSAGIVDLPVAREAATDYPFVAGSGLKGALRDRAVSLGLNTGRVTGLFGKPEEAGGLRVSDARLLLLPVRSLTGTYRWLTSALVLERYDRDRRRCGLSPLPPLPATASTSETSGVFARSADSRLYLEEREFAVVGECPEAVVESILPLMYHDLTKARLAQQIAVVCDNDFVWFCRFALPVQARNVLEKDGTKRSVNLWYEESLPADTLLYTVIASRDDQLAAGFVALFPQSDPYLQMGGNETVGQGWVAVSVVDEAAGVRS